MSTFRTALRVVAGHPIYLVLYVVFLSLMGVFVVGDMGVATSGEKGGYAAYEARVAVVDRDGSALSDALAAWVSDAFEARGHCGQAARAAGRRGDGPGGLPGGAAGRL